MAETTVVASEAFWEWLKKTPAALARFASVVKEFYDLQNSAYTPVQPSVPDGPLDPDTDVPPPALVTVPITADELDLMMNDRADDQVKEKALIWLQGFFVGLAVH